MTSRYIIVCVRVFVCERDKDRKTGTESQRERDKLANLFFRTAVPFYSSTSNVLGNQLLNILVRMCYYHYTKTFF